MKNKFILLTVMLGLLLAGCTSQESPAPSAPSDTTSESGTNGAGSADTETSDSSADTSTDTSGDSSSGASEPEDSGTSGSSGNDFSGLDYAGVMALGLPGECDISSESNGQTIQVKVYFDGAGNARSETPMDAQDTGCAKFIVIQKTGKIYIGCENTQYPPGTDCDWMMMESEAESGTSSMETEIDFGGGSYDTDYTDVPSSKISCKPWILDPSKFQASGKACTIQDLMQGYTP